MAVSRDELICGTRNVSITDLPIQDKGAFTKGNDCVSVRDTEEQHGEDRKNVLG